MALTLLDLILIIIAAVAVFVLVAIYLGWIFGVLTQKPKTGAESLIGKLGTAESDILPEMGGDVNVDGIIWRAMLQENESSIERNSQVVVIRVSSLKLIVRKIKDGDQGKRVTPRVREGARVCILYHPSAECCRRCSPSQSF